MAVLLLPSLKAIIFLAGTVYTSSSELELSSYDSICSTPSCSGVEMEDSMLLQTSQVVGGELLRSSTQTASEPGTLMEGLATGVAMINPLLAVTDDEYTYSDDGEVPASHTARGELTNRTEHGDDDDEHPGEKKRGMSISKAIGSDLLGDSLNPTHGGEGRKQPIHHETETHHESHHSSHGYTALLFLFGGLTAGAFILMVQERFLEKLPYTCLLFIAGFLIAVVHHWKRAKALRWESWGHSVGMWESINPHLLFYVFLPALVFSEAMRLDKHMVRSCIWQILLLAGPGVVLGTFLVGAFCRFVLPYGWSWPICLVVGAVLSATDPVAVVALFKTLGVSPHLTMVVSGESLLNDGTSLVLFALMLKVALGATLTIKGVTFFFLNMTVVSVVMGFVIATLAIWVISCCALERGPSDAMIQVVITITTAYTCFFLAESELSTSGILSLVSAGFGIACSAWPKFVNKEVVNTVWEAIEFIGNTMIFLLAGLLFGDSCLSRSQYIWTADLGWLVLIYLAAMLIRAILIILLWLPLKLVGEPLSWREGLVLVWSGLRGAVSLVMAIIVDAEEDIDKNTGSHIMFFVGGVATLTLVINGTTTAGLLEYLGLMREPKERERLLLQVERHLVHNVSTAFSDMAKVTSGQLMSNLDCQDDLRFAGADPNIVMSMVPMLGQAPSSVGPHRVRTRIQPFRQSRPIEDHELMKARSQVYREIFLKFVQNSYWEAIEQNIIPRNNKVSKILLSSIDEAMVDVGIALTDWHSIKSQVDIQPPRPGSLWNCLATWAQYPMMGWIPGLTQHLPNAEVIRTWKVFAVLSYQEAHKCARTEVPQYFRECEDADVRVQELVAEESRHCCREVGRLLEGVEESAVTFGRSRMLAQKLLRLQLEQVASLKSHGVLTASEGGSFDEKLHNALLLITRADAQWQRKF